MKTVMVGYDGSDGAADALHLALAPCPLLVTPRGAEREFRSPELPPYVAMAR